MPVFDYPIKKGIVHSQYLFQSVVDLIQSIINSHDTLCPFMSGLESETKENKN